MAVLAAASTGGWFFLHRSGPPSGSIAVLPFANLSGDPAQAYFSDGMAEELRNALSRIAGLKVVARTSSEMLRDADAKTAARKLDVDNILTGSVRRSTSTIRVAAQLVDGRNGLELWSQSFDRPFGDILQIQSGIATRVAEALSIRLGSKDRAALSLGGTKNAAAQDLLLKASPARTAKSQSGLLHALALVDAAIALDPNYAEAYVRRAFVIQAYAGTYAREVAEYRSRLADAKASARRAISIEPRLAGGYASLGAIYQSELDTRGALAEFRRALAQPGSDVITLRTYSWLLAHIGQFDEALRMIEAASELDPLDPGSVQTHLSILNMAGRYIEAVKFARGALRMRPGNSGLHTSLGNALLMLGRYAEARREYLAVPADNIHRMIGLASLAAREGDHPAAERLRQDLVRLYGDVAHYQYAQIDSQLGNKDRAFAELEMAWKNRDPGLATMPNDPFMDPLKGDPRYRSILARLNFP